MSNNTPNINCLATIHDLIDTDSDEYKFYKKRKQLLEKFGPEWIQKMKHSALAHNVFSALVQSSDPYSIIKRLITVIEEQDKAFVNLLR